MTINHDVRDSCDGKCSICGGTATAFWDGVVHRVEICPVCGTTKVIQLIVDSLPCADLPTAVSVWETCTAAWYRALAYRWAREQPSDGEDAA